MKIITKVKNNARKFDKNFKKNVPGWAGVLADIQGDIQRLQEYACIVQRKIERGEPWPTQPENQTTEPCQSV
jgi:hypothetical protein